MTIDLFSLRCFVAVAETQHFGNAARALFVSQAQLSKRIRDLESELGAVLLERTTRSVGLTEVGAEVLVEARQVLSHISAMEEKARRAVRGEIGTLALGVVGSVTFTLLPRIMRVLRQELPGVDVSIRAELLTPEQERMLHGHEIDMGILRLPVRSSGLTWRVIDRDPLMAAVPRDHRLARLDEPVDATEFRDEPMVIYPRTSGSVVGEAVVRQCARAGFEPNVAVEVTDTSTMLGLVSAGIGIALVPSSASRLAVEDVVMRQIRHPEMVEIAVAWRENDTSPLLRSCLSALRESGAFLEPGPPPA